MVMTDGEQNDQYGGRRGAVETAVAVHQSVELYTIGFGGALSDTVSAMASSPSSEYAYSASDMDEVLSVFSNLCAMIDGPELPPPPSLPPLPPDPPLPPADSTAPPATPPTRCGDACLFVVDGTCDDGGPGSESSICLYGEDCADCGPRLTFSPPHPLPATPAAPYSPPPRMLQIAHTPRPRIASSSTSLNGLNAGAREMLKPP